MAKLLKKFKYIIKLYSIKEVQIIIKKFKPINKAYKFRIHPNDGKNLEELIQNADYAMYQAKKRAKI